MAEDFILRHSKIRQRNGQSLNKEYDIIIGNVEDDDVFKTVDMYFRGLWNKEKVLNELRYYKMNNQINSVAPKYWDKFKGIASGLLDYGYNQMTNEILYWTGS